MKWRKFLNELNELKDDVKVDKKDPNIVYWFDNHIRIERISENCINIYSYVDIVPDLLMEIMIPLSDMRFLFNFEIKETGVFYKAGNRTYWNDEAIDENEKMKTSDTINMMDQIDLLENSRPEDLPQC